MSGGSHVYQTGSPSGQVGELPGDFVRAVVEERQLPVAGNANCLSAGSAGQPSLSGLTRRAESHGPARVEMVLPGDTPVPGGTRDQEFTAPVI
jgi:hypothetical protein